MKKNELTKEELFEAIKQGVKEALNEIMDTGVGYNGLIGKEQVMDAIKRGVFEVFEQNFPWIDMKETMEEGIRKAFADNIPLDFEKSIKDIYYAAVVRANGGPII